MQRIQIRVNRQGIPIRQYVAEADRRHVQVPENKFATFLLFNSLATSSSIYSENWPLVRV